MTAKVGDVWFRYANSGTTIYREEFPVAKLTPKGVWLDDYGKLRFVLYGHKEKRWAYANDEDARYSFYQRKRWQVKHLERQLKNAQACLERVNKTTYVIAADPVYGTGPLFELLGGGLL